ncbi:MAG TPA: PHB depolymerase family esterase [Lacunisphaera sp.]|nr:PHB depolymerase family esterase [Lacunisphaera sp.]
MRKFFPALAFLFLAGVTARAEGAGAALAPGSFESEITLPLGYRYLLALPEGYAADESKRWPLVVFLHGAGERGRDLELLKKHGVPRLIAAGRKFEAIVVAPQVPEGEYWNPHGVKALVDELARKHRVDETRIYLTGLSMGGFGVFDTLAAYPGVFAAAVPICGGAGINVVKFAALREMPIWMFHGDRDQAVPVEYSQTAMRWFERIQAPNVKLTIYPGVTHDSWTRTYDNSEVWAWLFAHRKGQGTHPNAALPGKQ